jgi:hypothetical protein
MSENRDRAQSSQENKQVTDTAKALIDLYKSAFGDNWQNVFSQTVRVEVGSA